MTPNPTDLRASAIVLAAHRTSTTLQHLRERVRLQFPDPIDHYAHLDIDAYREVVVSCQRELNREGFVRKIVAEIHDELRRYTDGDRFLCQSNLYLRATRPQVSQHTEAIGWHRETFYGPNMERSINVWTPVQGVVESNTLRFVPRSHLIADADIVVEQYEDPITRKGSTGNTLGFLYAPKKIVGGVDLGSAVPMNVPANHSAIFPGNLIHGGAVNLSDQIRFSLDFRVIPLRFYDKTVSKQIHAASGKPYFEEY
jgi:hypothetical protein